MSSIASIASPLTGQLQQTLSMPAPQLEKLAGTGASQAGASTSITQSFGKTIGNFVGEVDTQIKTATAERNKVISGETTNLHQAMIANQEASIGFSSMIELRNKLVESYQELMRSQV